MANGNSAFGFDYPNKGPFGICLQEQLQTTFDQNSAFSQRAWENAKQNCQYGCVLPPGIPQWPPGVTPLSAPATMGLAYGAQFASSVGLATGSPVSIPMTDPQIINTLQAKPFQFDSPYVARKEYARFVPNDSPAVVKSLENGCGIPAAIAAGALVAGTQGPVSPIVAGASVASGNLLSMFAKSFLEAVRGVVYDAKNWKQLPGETGAQKLKFMASHDSSRAGVLAGGILILLAIIVFIVLLCYIGCCRNCS
jgi:hypothetical protein